MRDPFGCRYAFQLHKWYHLLHHSKESLAALILALLQSSSPVTTTTVAAPITGILSAEIEETLVAASLEVRFTIRRPVSRALF